MAKEGAGALTWEDLPAIFAEYEALAQAYLERHRRGGPSAITTLRFTSTRPCLYKRTLAAAPATSTLPLPPRESFIPVTSSWGGTEFLLGTVYQGLKTRACRRFQEAHVYNKGECASAGPAFTAAAAAMPTTIFTGDLLTPYPWAVSSARSGLNVPCGPGRTGGGRGRTIIVREALELLPGAGDPTAGAE